MKKSNSANVKLLNDSKAMKRLDKKLKKVSDESISKLNNSALKLSNARKVK